MTQSCNLHCSAQAEMYWLSWYQMTVQVQVHMHQNRIDRYTRSLVVSWHLSLSLMDPLQKKIITKSRISHLDTEDRIGDQKCLQTANLYIFFQNAHVMVRSCAFYLTMMLICCHGMVKCIDIEKCSCIKTFHFLVQITGRHLNLCYQPMA